MKILVFDVAAEKGGALSVLREVHAAATRAQEHQWVFVTSIPTLPEATHVRLRRFPWVKKSLFLRLIFEALVAPHIARWEQPDVVLSLQNIAVPRVTSWQVIYVHTASPFSVHRFSLKNEPRLWLHARITKPLILRSIHRADRVIVQTHWMKQSIVKSTRINDRRVVVAQPPVAPGRSARQYEPTLENRRRFFYPAAPLPYKNHSLLFAAAESLAREGIDIDVFCTISSEDLSRLGLSKVPGNVHLLGELPYEQVQEEYARSVLIFPSVLETVGLPTVEARARQSFVLAADLPYAREVLDGYANAQFFDPYDPQALAMMIKSVATGTLGHSISKPKARSAGSWDDLIGLLAVPEFK